MPPAPEPVAAVAAAAAAEQQHALTQISEAFGGLLADLQFSFVISSARAADLPIIYASPSFFDCTGYMPAEVLGRNCRFLQVNPPAGAAQQQHAHALLQQRPPGCGLCAVTPPPPPPSPCTRAGRRHLPSGRDGGPGRGEGGARLLGLHAQLQKGLCVGAHVGGCEGGCGRQQSAARANVLVHAVRVSVLSCLLDPPAPGCSCSVASLLPDTSPLPTAPCSLPPTLCYTTG